MKALNTDAEEKNDKLTLLNSIGNTVQETTLPHAAVEGIQPSLGNTVLDLVVRYQK